MDLYICLFKRTVIEMNTERRRPKKKWLNAIELDMRAAGVCMKDVRDSIKGRFKTKVADPK